VKYEVYQSKL